MVHVAATQQQQQKRYVTKTNKRPAGRPGHHRKGTAQVGTLLLLALVNTCSVSLRTAVGAARRAVLVCLCALLLEQELDRGWPCKWHLQSAAC